MYTIEEIEKIPFVFIVGRGRSGSTLLQNILDANKNVLMPIELFDLAIEKNSEIDFSTIKKTNFSFNISYTRALCCPIECI